MYTFKHFFHDGATPHLSIHNVQKIRNNKKKSKRQEEVYFHFTDKFNCARLTVLLSITIYRLPDSLSVYHIYYNFYIDSEYKAPDMEDICYVSISIYIWH